MSETSRLFRAETGANLAQILEGREGQGPLASALRSASEVSFRQAFNQISGSEQEALRIRIGREELQAFLSLSEETDPECFFAGLNALAAHLEQQDKLELAAGLYSLVSRSATFPALQRRATEGLDAILGRGAVGPRVEFLLRRFAHDASDYRMIVPMLAGNVVSSLVSTASLGRLTMLGTESLWARGFGARFTAASLGYLAEVPTFVGTERWLRSVGSLTPNSATWSHDLASAGLTLGSLRLFGLAGEATLRRLHRLDALGNATRFTSVEALTRSWVPQFAAFGGLLSSQRLEQEVGLRPRVDGATTVTDTLASMFSLGVGARLGHRLLGADFAAFHQGLEWRSRQLELLPLRAPIVARRPGLSLRPERVALAGLGAGLGVLLSPHLAHAAVESANRAASGGSLTEWLLGLGAGLGVLAMARAEGPYRVNLHGEILQPLEQARVVDEDSRRGTKTLQLTRDQEVQGNRLPKDSRIYLDLDRGSYTVTLSKDAEIGGIRMPQRGSVEIDLQGRPISVRLPNYPWEDNPFWGNAFAILGKSFIHSSVVHFDLSGRIDSVVLSLPQWIDGIPCANQGAVRFHPNGRLRSAVLARSAKIGGVSFEGGSEISLDETGSLMAVRRSTAAKPLDKIVYPAYLRSGLLTSASFFLGDLIAYWLHPGYGPFGQLAILAMSGFLLYKASNRVWERRQLQRSLLPEGLPEPKRPTAAEPQEVSTPRIPGRLRVRLLPEAPTQGEELAQTEAELPEDAPENPPARRARLPGPGPRSGGDR